MLKAVSESVVVRKKILNVEDDYLLSMFQTKSLEDAGYEVLVAHSGADALNIVDKEEHIDLVIMDIDLGEKMDGTEIAKEILKKHKLPIVFLTSHHEQEYVDKVRGITNYGYVLKNSGDFVLLQQIENAFNLFEANMKLAKSEEIFKSIVHNSNALTFLTDSSASVTYVSPQCEAVLGWPGDKFLGQYFPDIIHPDDVVRCREKWLSVMQGRSLLEYEYRIIDMQGEIRWISHSAQLVKAENTVIGMQNSIRNITEFKKTAELNKQMNIQYQTLVENINDVIYSLDLEGIITYVSPVLERISGYKVNELIGQKFDSFVHPDDLDGLNKKIINTLSGESTSYEFRVIDKTGEIHYVRTSSRAISNNGKMIGVSGVMIDVTEKKMAEEKNIELLRKNLVLLAEKEILLKEVHHRIKNNMNIIASLLSMHAKSLQEPSAIDALQDARSRIISMMVLYDKLYKSEEFRTISLNDYLPQLIDEIVSMFHGKRIVKVEKHIADIVLDTKILVPVGIILNELITNSLKYAFKKRKIESIINVTIQLRDKNILEMIISDNGHGLPENIDQDAPRGFGLELVQILAKQLIGKVKIKSVPEKGTEFNISFKI